MVSASTALAVVSWVEKILGSMSLQVSPDIIDCGDKEGRNNEVDEVEDRPGKGEECHGFVG